MKRYLLAAILAAAVAAQAADLSKTVILVAKPELRDALYGATVLVVTPVGGDQHVGFIVNRPTQVTLAQVFPDDGPSQKVVDPLYRGGPNNPQVVFALVRRATNPGSSFQLMPGLYAAVGAETIDRIIARESDHARFVAGLVVWQRGELHAEVESGAWYVLAPDADLALRKPTEGLWEELVRISKLRADAI